MVPKCLMGVIRKKSADVRRLNIRLTPNMLTAVDDACGRRAGTLSRNTWIAEAIAEKLARETIKELGVNSA
jgi:metal-responsive CopG/Arc/MetJ family transcriptional regulator